MAITYTLIQSITLGSNNSTITFSNIPNSYTDLMCITTLRSANNNYGGYQVRPNAVTTGYTRRGIRGAYTNLVQAQSGSAPTDVSYLPTSGSTANIFSNDWFYIANYQGTQAKSFFTHSGQVATTGSNDATIFHDWMITTSANSALTSLVLTMDTDQFLAGSSASLYGIKNS